MVIRPKSSATVVVVFCSIPDRSSTSRLASVISSSVRNGGISLTDATIVVLPTPKPPATRSFTADTWRSTEGSEPTNAIDHRLEHVEIGSDGRPEDDQLTLDE